MAESADSPMNQEILLGGHFYLMVLKVSVFLHHIVQYIPSLNVVLFVANCVSAQFGYLVCPLIFGHKKRDYFCVCLGVNLVSKLMQQLLNVRNHWHECIQGLNDECVMCRRRCWSS